MFISRFLSYAIEKVKNIICVWHLFAPEILNALKLFSDQETAPHDTAT